MTFSEELASAIEGWLATKASRSLSMISRMTGVSYSTVRRAAQKEAEPTQETALSIASLVMNEYDYQAFANKYWPTLKKYVVDVADSTSQNEQVIEFLRSSEHCKIIVLASGQGTSEDEIKKLYGENSLNHFNDLVDAGLLVKDEEEKWVFDGRIGSSSFELARIILSNFTGMCRRDNDYKKSVASSWVGWESVNESSAKKLNELAAEYCSQAAKIIKNPANKGEVLVFAGVLSNVLRGEELIK